MEPPPRSRPLFAGGLGSTLVRLKIGVNPVKRRLRHLARAAASVPVVLALYAGAAAQHGGGAYLSSELSLVEFNRRTMQEQEKNARAARQDREKLVAEGALSALDLQAPDKAVAQFNQALALLKEQKTKPATLHLKNALAAYPKFVSAHNLLGQAYLDDEELEQARSEFEIAAKLDDKFPASFLNLGRLELRQQDFTRAARHLQKAAALRPQDPLILTALSFAQHGTGQYREAIKTAARLHTLDHKGMATAHYIAASSAIALQDYPVVQRELELFLQEDPANPMAPAARHNLDTLARERAASSAVPRASAAEPQTFPNTERLRSQLVGLDDSPADTPCTACDDVAAAPAAADAAPAAPEIVARDQGWTLRLSVDEVAVFFWVTSHGGFVRDLQLGDIRILDDKRPPQRVLQFTQQSKLPLLLGLVVDTSGSVRPRFSFEQRTAIQFMREMLSQSADLGFVEGFANAPTVTQDFTSDHAQLAAGVNRLENHGGTALFDAVSHACWKLAAYPEQERVAKVLVVLSDGEDNSSRRSLKQTLQDAEITGVTIYTISTKQVLGAKTDADHVLEALAARTGGEAMFSGAGSLDATFRQLRDLIRSRYLVAYKPADFRPDGKFRSITITARKDGERLRVHARDGYHARRAPR